MDGTGDLFAPLLRELPPEWDVQVVRYPVNFDGGYAQLTDFARALLPIDRDYVLLGESFSGPIAIQLAAETPPHLRGVILGCAFASNPRPRLTPYIALANLIPARLLSARFVMKVLLGRYADPYLCQLLQHAIRSVPKAALIARLQAIAAIDVRKQLSQIQVPTLYLQAGDDMLVPASITDRMRALLPAMQVDKIDGSHFLLQCAPKACAGRIALFAADLSPLN